ncbi:hypothetical protein SCAR479_11356 [Seiridium cardinale]|uniref:DUF4224 domain-containing protein n=1 Tax=Seiridium cardinale TaxID=138064 RepID=A0ABR2XE80_9PEZI
MQLLHDRILERIEACEYPKTTRPSEVARGLSSDELSSLGCADWARRDGLGEAITVDRLEEVRGPIRLRKKAAVAEVD